MGDRIFYLANVQRSLTDDEDDNSENEVSEPIDGRDLLIYTIPVDIVDANFMDSNNDNDPDYPPNGDDSDLEGPYADDQPL